MKKLKLLLINPKTKNSGLSASRFLRLPPLNLRILEKYTDQDSPSFQVTIVDEFKKPVEEYPDLDFDVVGITAMTPAAPRAYAIAKMFKDKGIKTILGGIHASVMPDEAEEYVDCVVTGEIGPKLWANVLVDFQKGKLKKRYDAGLLSDMSQIPKVSKLSGYVIPYTIQRSRGCPLACDFCSVSAVNGRIVRSRPDEEVIAELKKAKQGGVKYFVFVDDNICPAGAENEAKSINFFKKLAKANLGLEWGSQTGVNFGNNPEALYWAAKSGCKAVFMGFESLNKVTLKKMNKVFNVRQMSENAFLEPVKNIHKAGIAIIGGFIFGNDSDDKGVFERTKKFIFEAKLDGAQYSILTPLPGTKLFQDLKQQKRLLYTNFPQDWEKYDVQTPVVKPKGISIEKLVQNVLKLYKETNSFFPSATRAWSTFLTTKDPFMTAGMMITNLGYLNQAENLFKDLKLL